MASKYNAVKHGLLVKELVVRPNESRIFNKLARNLLEELQPKTITESILAEQVILNYWRLRRFMRLENDVLDFSGERKHSFDDPRFIVSFVEFVKGNPALDLLSRYHSSISRSFYRALREYYIAKNGNSHMNKPKDANLS